MSVGDSVLDQLKTPSIMETLCEAEKENKKTHVSECVSTDNRTRTLGLLSKIKKIKKNKLTACQYFVVHTVLLQLLM